MTPEFEHSSEPIRLPRHQLIFDAISEISDVPRSIEQRANVPERVERARSELTYQFLERVLLPRMKDEKPLVAGELAQQATDFKITFRQENRDFVGDYELITSAELKLMELHVFYKAQAEHKEGSETAQLVERALTQVKPLLDNHPEDLFSI
jgi:hypothetical protein